MHHLGKKTGLGLWFLASVQAHAVPKAEESLEQAKHYAVDHLGNPMGVPSLNQRHARSHESPSQDTSPFSVGATFGETGSLVKMPVTATGIATSISLAKRSDTDEQPSTGTGGSTVDTTKATPDGTAKVTSDGTKATSDGTTAKSDGTTAKSDGTTTAKSDGTAKVTDDGTAKATSDGTKATSDGTKAMSTGTDGTSGSPTPPVVSKKTTTTGHTSSASIGESGSFSVSMSVQSTRTGVMWPTGSTSGSKTRSKIGTSSSVSGMPTSLRYGGAPYPTTTDSGEKAPYPTLKGSGTEGPYSTRQASGTGTSGPHSTPQGSDSGHGPENMHQGSGSGYGSYNRHQGSGSGYGSYNRHQGSGNGYDPYDGHQGSGSGHGSYSTPQGSGNGYDPYDGYQGSGSGHGSYSTPQGFGYGAGDRTPQGSGTGAYSQSPADSSAGAGKGYGSRPGTGSHSSEYSDFGNKLDSLGTSYAASDPNSQHISGTSYGPSSVVPASDSTPSGIAFNGKDYLQPTKVTKVFTATFEVGTEVPQATPNLKGGDPGHEWTFGKNSTNH